MATHKDFKPEDIARILRALDLGEFAAAMHEVSIDVSLYRPSEARARLLAEAGTRAMFVAFVDPIDYTDEQHDNAPGFVMDNTPAPDYSTSWIYGRTSGLLGDLLKQFAQDFAWDRLKEFTSWLIKRGIRIFRR